MTIRRDLEQVEGGYIHEETDLFIERVHVTRWAIWESHGAYRRRGSRGLALDWCESLAEAREAIDAYQQETQYA